MMDDWHGKHYAFYQNRECECFPCHPTEHPEDFRNFYAMELNDPAEQSGYAAVFRRECTPDPEICPGLREIDEAADYEVENQHGERETVSPRW